MTLNHTQPDAKGFFGRFGGSFISEMLSQAVEELRLAYFHYRDDPDFLVEFQAELADYVGRPTPVYYARRLSDETGGARIFLKREDLNHTGAQKINNVIGQLDGGRSPAHIRGSVPIWKNCWTPTPAPPPGTSVWNA